MSGPKLLVTGFGPFPNAPENPTEALVRSLLAEPPQLFGAAALHGIVLPTEYRRSWSKLRRVFRSCNPDVVVHFGLSRRAACLTVERAATRRIDPDRPDAAGFAPPSGRAWRSGPETLPSALPPEVILAALAKAGIPAAASDDAGAYVCNATFYRSLLAAPPGRNRLVGFVHVPPVSGPGLGSEDLQDVARVVLSAASAHWAEAPGVASGDISMLYPPLS